MERKDHEFELAESTILEALGDADSTYSPAQLVEHLKSRENFDVSEEVISVALWDLIGRAAIELSQGWKLKVANSEVVA